MRRALLSVCVGLAGVAALLVIGLALQSAALPLPPRPNQIAANASRWLDNYAYSIDVFHSHDRRLSGACLRGWYPRRRGARPLKRGSLLVLHGGPVLLATGGGRRRIRFISDRRRGDLPAFLAIETGCTLPLANMLYKAAQGHTRLTMERAFAANQPAIALEIPNVRDERLTVYVSPRGYRPLVAIAASEGQTTTARIYLARATLRLRFHYRQLLSNGEQDTAGVRTHGGLKTPRTTQIRSSGLDGAGPHGTH